LNQTIQKKEGSKTGGLSLKYSNRKPKSN
jgi:hypothetical protein